MTSHISEEFSTRLIDWSPFVILGNTMPPRDAAAEVPQDRNQKSESAEREGRRKFRAHEIKHDAFRLMRPGALLGRLTHRQLAFGSCSNCRIADDTGEIDARWIAPKSGPLYRRLCRKSRLQWES
jgi:hypothetical protein